MKEDGPLPPVPQDRDENDFVSITRSEYESLLEDRDMMRALESAGVDNWDGYSIAQDMLRAESDVE